VFCNPLEGQLTPLFIAYYGEFIVSAEDSCKDGGWATVAYRIFSRTRWFFRDTVQLTDVEWTPLVLRYRPWGRSNERDENRDDEEHGVQFLWARRVWRTIRSGVKTLYIDDYRLWLSRLYHPTDTFDWGEVLFWSIIIS
jgi:hypothetical protein